MKRQRKALHQILVAQQRHGRIWSLWGFPGKRIGKLYNVAAAISDGQLLGDWCRRDILPNYAEFYEARHFTPGNGSRREVAEFEGQQVPFGSNLLFTL